MKAQVPSAVAPDTRGEAVTPAGHPGPGDGVLDCPVSQPACIAPVQAVLPGLEELCEGGQCGILLLAGLLCSQEAHMVTTTRVLVGKHHTWVEELIRQLSLQCFGLLQTKIVTCSLKNGNILLLASVYLLLLLITIKCKKAHRVK